MSRDGLPGEKAGWCVHYRYRDEAGRDSDTCEAGVQYSSLPKPSQTRPCFLTDKGESKPHATHCEHLRRPTSDEIEARAIWRRSHMEKLYTVLAGIAGWRAANKGRSHAEVVECPACAGRLHLSIAAYNGHVHGRCETTDCVSWME